MVEKIKLKKTFETFHDLLSIVKKILITLTGPHSKSYATCNDIYKQLKLFIESAPGSILVGIFQRQPYLCDTSTGAHSSCHAAKCRQNEKQLDHPSLRTLTPLRVEMGTIMSF